MVYWGYVPKRGKPMSSRLRRHHLSVFSDASNETIDCVGLDRDAPLRELTLRMPTLAEGAAISLISDADTFPTDVSRYCARNRELTLVGVDRTPDGFYRATVRKRVETDPYVSSVRTIASARPVTTTVVIDLSQVGVDARVVRVGSRIAEAKSWATHARVLAPDASSVASLASWCAATGHAIVDATAHQDGGYETLIHIRTADDEADASDAYAGSADSSYHCRLATDDATRFHQALQQALATRASKGHAAILFADGAIQLLRSTVALVMGSHRLTRLVNRVSGARQSDEDIVLADELHWASAAGVELLVSAETLAELGIGRLQLIGGEVLQLASQQEWERLTGAE